MVHEHSYLSNEMNEADEVDGPEKEKNIAIEQQGANKMDDITQLIDGACSNSTITGAASQQCRMPQSTQRDSVAGSSNGNLTSTVNSCIPPYDENNSDRDELNICHSSTSFNLRQYRSSSEDSSDENECRIIPMVRDDYLETLDRKVTEVINQSRISNAGLMKGGSSDLSRKSSGSKRQHHRNMNKPSPGSSKKISMKTPASSSDNIAHVASSSNCVTEGAHLYSSTMTQFGGETENHAHIGLPQTPSSNVRFDEAHSGIDNDSDTQESSQERWSDDGEDVETEDGKHLDDRHMIKRRR